jgi:hypothetical protein
MFKFIWMAILMTGLCSFALFEPLKGIWSNGNGQTLEFGKSNTCLWIFDTDGRKDTFEIPFRYEKIGKDSGLLDLGPFAKGVLKGKTLYGIVAWSKNKKEFRYDAEPGKSATVRPVAFNPQQVQVYNKVK